MPGLGSVRCAALVLVLVAISVSAVGAVAVAPRLPAGVAVGQRHAAEVTHRVVWDGATRDGPQTKVFSWNPDGSDKRLV
jgi:hypothetical protein